MDFFDILLSKTLSGGGGGGGSSDLSTCTMTVTGLHEGAYAEILFPTIEDNSYYVGTLYASSAPNGNFLLPLYKGAVLVEILDANYTVSGNATNVDTTLFVATGDFTISFSTQ